MLLTFSSIEKNKQFPKSTILFELIQDLNLSKIKEEEPNRYSLK